jgi:AAA domain
MRVFVQALIRNCEIPREDCSPPSFAIRLYQSFKKGAPDPDILNSFFLDDLQRAKHSIETGSPNNALCAYLGIRKTENEFDLLKNKTHIEYALQPKNMPLGRWPSKGRHSLVLLQQVAVNLARMELKSAGLFSVNGPPGTGKTTLLRDIVASVLVDRAIALNAFKNTDDAFEHAGQMRLGNSFVHLYRLHESLRGHEIVVASTNNKAVENVSKELPLCEQVADDIEGLNYFKTISNALSGSEDETWGSIAAVLGNSKNRHNFTQKAWWDFDSGLKSYFHSITGQVDFEVDDNGDEIIPKIVEECAPPSSPEDANRRWAEARKRFDEAVLKSNNIRDKAQRAYEATGQVVALRKIIKGIKSKYDDQTNVVNKAQKNKDTLSAKISEIELRHSDASDRKLSSEQEKPGFLKRLFARRIWRAWKDKHDLLVSGLTSIQSELKHVQDKQGVAIKDYVEKFRRLNDLSKELVDSERAYQKACDVIEKETAICGGKLVTAELWKYTHEEQQKFTPNYTPVAQIIRDDVFVAAMALHKAFIDASAKQVRQNLGAYFYCLGNGSLPQDKQPLLPHLWSTAFLFTPVISTAFASVGRMLKKLPKDSIGWLLIDEAGQATPQAAVGAICRAKRVMSVGDPLQIEPVFPLSPALVEGISRHMGVEPYQWMAPNASVQTLSDHANSYGTTIGRDLSEIRIGAPLLVHRRCEDPMFRISNKMAYNGLMVHATQTKASETTSLFDAKTKWFNLEGVAQEKWCPEEGEHVAAMLLKVFETFGNATDIFVISPFRMVADHMKRRMRQEVNHITACGVEDPELWGRENIGTVHTFQGKEAQTVILLLGAPDPAQNGARNWATSNVNLLNVAVSRAKQNFYVVGNQKLWCELGHMKIISRNIILK